MFSPADLDRRIVFHRETEILEMNLQDMRFTTQPDVNAFYDRVEERIATSGEQLWFFLVNYDRTWIDSAVWFLFSQRGRNLNLAHSMGSVRFAPSGTSARDADGIVFDPNLFDDRESALAHLKGRRSKRWKKPGQAERDPFSRDELLWRVAFLTADRIMDVNLAHLTFRTAADIDALYDFVEEQVAGTGRRWFILENFDGTRVEPPARPRHDARDAALRDSWSLGSVAYAPGGSARETPEFRETREDALAAIAALKADAVPQG